MNFSLILATDINNGIGKNNTLPWSIKDDMKRFALLTKNSYVIMGRNTADSLPCHLKTRTHIVITSNEEYANDVLDEITICDSLNSALLHIRKLKDDRNVFVIGGKRMYEEGIKHKRCNTVYLTKIHNDYDCDVNMDDAFYEELERFNVADSVMISTTDSNGTDVCVEYIDYVYDNYQEIEYLKLGDKILKYGDKRQTRNSVTYSLFGNTVLEFDLSKGFPIFTTKNVPFRLVAEELLFFLRGDTDTKMLMDKNVNIWKGNTCKEFLENNNKDLNEWDMGPMYGYQWRNFNSKNIDQVKYVIDELVDNPMSRRIVMTTYNPEEVNDGVLYPCHGLVTQFYVRGDSIDLQTYQRSADYFLGLPFNITSYSLLLHIIVSIVNSKCKKLEKDIVYKPGRMITVLGDVHIYDNHIDAVRTQLDRCDKTMPFPELEFDDIEDLDDINDLGAEYFNLIGYVKHPRISADMIA